MLYPHPKVTFQLKKTGKRHTVVLRLNIATKKVLWTLNHKTYGPYKSHYISTKFDIKPSEWDSKRRRAKGKNPLNTALDNIEKLTKEVHYTYWRTAEGNPDLIINAIKKIVFGFQIRTQDVVFKENSILPAYQDETLPVVTGDAATILEKKAEYDEKEFVKGRIKEMNLIDYIKNVYLVKRTDLEPGSVKSYSNIQAFIRSYNPKTKVCDLNEEWVMKFMDWARKRKQDDGSLYSYNYINTCIQKQLKAVSNYLVTYDKIPNDIAWKKKEIRKSGTKTDEIALNLKQLKTIIDLDLTGARKREKDIPTLELSRDLMIIGCLTSLRVSDIKKIHLNKIGKDKYQLDMITQKTKAHVKFIVHPLVGKIYEKYNGKIPGMSDSKLNKNVKELGKLAYEKGHFEFGTEYIKKKVDPDNINRNIATPPIKFFERIKSSSFRRTWASYAVQSKLMSLDQICLVTGHSRISQLMEYCKTSEDDLNEKLATLYKKIKL
jgi:hypothetical protein